MAFNANDTQPNVTETMTQSDQQKLLATAQSDNLSDDISHWQRLSPIAMLYFAIKIIQQLFGNIVYIAPAIYVGFNHLLENPTLWLPVTLLVLFIIISYIGLTFYFFRYRLTSHSIEIRSGVLAKKYLNLPFDRIQNVTLEQPIYYRPFNFTCLQLDTAGSVKQEAKIVALPLNYAEKLKHKILSQKQAEPVSAEQASLAASSSKAKINAHSQEKLLNKRSLSDLIIHGLTNNRIWIFLGFLAPFFDDIGRYSTTFLTKVGVNTEQLFSFADKPWWQLGLYSITLTLLIFLPLSLFSIFGAVLAFYNYTLTKIDDRYIRRSGLLTKHEVTMKLSRLQMVLRQQDWLDLILKRINLTFEQNNANFKNVNAGIISNKLMVPSIKEHECSELINDVYPDNQLSTITFGNISKRYLLRNIGYFLLPIYAVFMGLFYLKENIFMMLVASVVALIISCLFYMRYLRWGLASDNNYIYVRSGVIGVDYRCFPIYKIQQTKFNQSIFQRRHQLCNISFVLASGSVDIPFVNQAEAQNLLQRCLFEVEFQAKPWM